MIKRFGPFLTIAVLLLGGLAWCRARSPADAVEALRGLATLLTVVTGVLSALWWHQSASLSDMPAETEERDRQRRSDANVLNGAAATATGLAVIGGVFTGLSPWSPEGVLAALSFVLLLAFSGDEIWLAAILSLRQGLHGRAAIAILVLVMASIMFVVRWLVD